MLSVKWDRTSQNMTGDRENREKGEGCILTVPFTFSTYIHDGVIAGVMSAVTFWFMFAR